MLYPIGIQTFEDLRAKNFVYVDKTDFVYKLASEGKYYFLSRPRRFGKSLLLTTLKAYFEGKSSLFKGLKIEDKEHDWITYPVIFIDFNNVERNRKGDLDEVLDEILKMQERKWGISEIAKSGKMRLRNLIHSAAAVTGKQVVVLIDEYDKPMLQNLENNEDYDAIRDKLKALFSVLKSEDAYIKFAMLTGVTRFSKVSVFSDLNNLNDISMDEDYATVCGITDDELHQVFDEEALMLAEKLNISKQECYRKMRAMYDGYHFSHDATAVYNPFSVLSAFCKRRFDSFWFATGTPSFLLTVMKRTGFDLLTGFDEPVGSDDLASVDSVKMTPLPILFQSGYLTIKSYDPEFNTYLLDYPNEEVHSGFANFLMKHYSAGGDYSATTIAKLVNGIRQGKADDVVEVFKTLFDKHGNCMLYEGKSKERDFRNIVYMIFCLLDVYTEAEISTSRGRMDLCCRTNDYVYIIELKIDQSAEQALKQIKSHEYAKKFINDTRTVILMGVNFSSATNSISDWKIEQISHPLDAHAF